MSRLLTHSMTKLSETDNLNDSYEQGVPLRLSIRIRNWHSRIPRRGPEGWIVLLPPNDVTISEPDNDIELTFSVKNDHPTDAQLVRTDVDRDSDLFFNIVNARIEQEDRDCSGCKYNS